MWAVTLIIIVIIIVAFILYMRHKARNKALEKMYGHVPSHTELYFLEYFEEMINNWDLITKKRAEEWSQDMDGRLKEVVVEIEGLKKRRKYIDPELDTIESRISTIERGVWKKEESK